MTPKEKEAIIQKCVELGFNSHGDWFKYDLPFGNSNSLSIDFWEGECTAYIEDIAEILPIRKIESPEDLENLFHAICPEKYRLPFG